MAPLTMLSLLITIWTPLTMLPLIETARDREPSLPLALAFLDSTFSLLASLRAMMVTLKSVGIWITQATWLRRCGVLLVFVLNRIDSACILSQMYNYWNTSIIHISMLGLALLRAGGLLAACATPLLSSGLRALLYYHHITTILPLYYY